MSVSAAECKLRNAEAHLKAALKSKEDAKKNGNYRTAAKNIRLRNGKTGNCYDSNIELFRDSVSRATKELAEAKKLERQKNSSKKQNKTSSSTKSSKSNSHKTSSRSSSSSKSSRRGIFSGFSMTNVKDMLDQLEELEKEEERMNELATQIDAYLDEKNDDEDEEDEEIEEDNENTDELLDDDDDNYNEDDKDLDKDDSIQYYKEYFSDEPLKCSIFLLFFWPFTLFHLLLLKLSEMYAPSFSYIEWSLKHPVVSIFISAFFWPFLLAGAIFSTFIN